MAKRGAVGRGKIQHNREWLTYHSIFDGLLASDYYRKHNVFSGAGFIPYNPLKPIKSTKLNMFTGFKYAVDGDLATRECVLYDYFFQNFTCEKEQLYALQWLAKCVQDPQRRLPVMILYSQEQGTGKSTLQTIVARLFDGYTLSVPDIGKSLLGNFNSQLANKLIINCSEVQSSDNGQRISISQNEVLKTLITESKLAIREKFVNEYEVDFYGKFTISCNYADAIRITKEDRRFSILDFGARNKGNAEYFNMINAAIADDEQIQILFNKLLFLDISDFDPNKPITTTAITQVAYRTNLPVAHKFIYNYIKNRELSMFDTSLFHNKIDFAAGTFEVKSSDLYNSYKLFCNNSGINHVQSLTAFGKTLGELKLNDGTAVIGSKKRSCVYRTIDANSAEEAIRAQLGDCSDDMLEELLV